MILLQGIGQGYYNVVKSGTDAFRTNYYGFLTGVFGR